MQISVWLVKYFNLIRQAYLKYLKILENESLD